MLVASHGRVEEDIRSDYMKALHTQEFLVSELIKLLEPLPKEKPKALKDCSMLEAMRSAIAEKDHLRT
ncbi:MAG: hypothetical protein N3D14_02300 [Aquificaceae bacterium]|nr:hypothetical protein [Aquificaceae bacterium]